MAAKKKGAKAADPNKKPRQKRVKLDIEIIDVLRDKNRELRKENELVNRQLIAEERETSKLQRRAHSAEKEVEAFMDALRALAEGAPNTMWAGREARKKARKILEAAGVRPPNTLGRSRESSPRKRKKKSS